MIFSGVFSNHFFSTGFSVGRGSEEIERFSLIPVPQQKNVKAETVFFHPLIPVDSSGGRACLVVSGDGRDFMPLALL